MKTRMLAVFVLGVISMLAINAIAQQGASRQHISGFSIELAIDRAANGVYLKCAEGCAWETLSFSCDPSGADCQGSFDQFGTPAR